MSDGPLVCPSCATYHGLDERFCPDCGMPLVHAGLQPVPERGDEARRERARKIKKQYTDGELVVIAGARHQAEAELIAGLLLEEGVPSLVRRSRGFDVPDMLAAGPRDVLVPASGVDVAREVLLQHDLAPSERAATVDPPWRILAWLGGALLLLALIAILFAGL